MTNTIKINNREIGEGHPVYVIAEMSANHNQDFNEALRIMRMAKDSGADAIKIQTYTADTMTIDCSNEYFQIGKGTIWEGMNLYKLYQQAYTPWEWQPELKKAADEMGIDFFSTPFDATAVDFLSRMDVQAYKIASFELTDLPLIEKVALQGKPMIISTGMSTIEEINKALETAAKCGNTQIALLKCTSAYPSPAEEMNLNTIPDMKNRFKLPVGLSDHSMELVVPLTAIALGASIIEKHFTVSRSVKGPDTEFSLEPEEFKEMVRSIRICEKALGKVNYEPSEKEKHSKVFRRSVFVVEDVKKGEKFTDKNVRVIRPSYGLPPECIKDVVGHEAASDLKRGTPLAWDMVKK